VFSVQCNFQQFNNLNESILPEQKLKESGLKTSVLCTKVNDIRGAFLPYPLSQHQLSSPAITITDERGKLCNENIHYHDVNKRGWILSEAYLS
jgi:hypothetical protein